MIANRDHQTYQILGHSFEALENALPLRIPLFLGVPFRLLEPAVLAKHCLRSLLIHRSALVGEERRKGRVQGVPRGCRYFSDALLSP